MVEVRGRYNTAVCYTPALEERAEAQIRAVCDRPEFAGCKIRIMPDVHAGRGCTVGTAMTVRDRVVPGMVGVDIGCGMETVELAEREMDFARLDRLIRERIPSGRDVRDTPHPLAGEVDLTALRCAGEVNLERARRSVGTLGGGNHFIEVDRASDGRLFLVIHSGSRRLGREVAEFYQDQGRRALWGGAKYQQTELIASLKAQGRQREIEGAIREFRREHRIDIPADLTYVEGRLFSEYIHDMRLTQRFAMLNRKAMAQVILSGMGLTAADEFTAVHNYIDTESMILRKGAVSARAGERLLIPINMRDGSLLCVGRGDPEWNFSTPHGAGRLMSRAQAKRTLTVEEFRRQMEGIYTTSVSPDTLDESPMAYKDMSEILAQIGPAAHVVEIIKPVYNFKAAE